MRTVLLGLALAAIGCGNGGKPMDMGTVDMTSDDAAAPDMAFTPMSSGTKLFGGMTNVILDTTSDDFAIVNTAGNMAGPLLAVKLSDATMQTIDPLYTQHSTFGKTVLSWSNQDANGVGTLILWTAADGPTAVGTASMGHTGFAAPDGSVALWTENGTNGLTFDLVVSTPKGLNKVTAITNVANDAATCPMNARFAGGKFFVSTCTLVPDAGIVTADVSAIAPNGTVTVVATGIAPGAYLVDPTGTKVLTVTPDNNANVTVVGGATSVIDNTMDFSNGFFSVDGNTVFWTNTAGKLSKTVVGGATSSILGSGVSVLQAISPQITHILFSSMVDMNNGTGDLSLLALSGTTPQQLVGMGAITGGGAGGYGDSWTTDGTQAIYFDNLDMNGTGTVHVQPTAGGAEKTMLPGVYYIFSAKDSKVAVNDNFVAVGMSGRADVKVIDLAGAGTPTLVATQAELDIQLSASLDYLIYNYYVVKGQEASYAFKIQ